MEDDLLQTLAKYLTFTVKRRQIWCCTMLADPMQGSLGKLALTDTRYIPPEMQVLSTCVSSGYPVACVIGAYG